MSVTVVVTFPIKPEFFDEIESDFKKNLPDTRAYDGCSGIDIYRNDDNPADIIAVQHWESRIHYEKYLAWRTETGTLDHLVGMLTGPPDIRYYARVDA